MYKVRRILIIRRIHASSSEESELDTSGGGNTTSTHMLHHCISRPRMRGFKIAASKFLNIHDDTIGQARMNCSLPSSQARMPFFMD